MRIWFLKDAPRGIYSEVVAQSGVGLTRPCCYAEIFFVNDERRILILDGPEGELQQLALDLLALDYSVHYANDEAEAQLLAAEEREHIAIVLIAEPAPLVQPAELARLLCVEPALLVPMGPRPPDKVLAGYQKAGLRWHLYGKPEIDSIRFVIASVLSEHDPMDLRFYLRVPAKINGCLQAGKKKGDVRINDVSLGGACILGDIVAGEGDSATLDFTIGELDLSLPVRIVWCVEGAGDGVEVAGLAFTELVPEAGDAIDGLVNSVILPYRIGQRQKR